MRRGESSSSSRKSSGGRNTSNTNTHTNTNTNSSSSSIPAHRPDASPSEAPFSPAGSITPTLASPAGIGADPGRIEGSNYLVALAGMKALESHVQDPSRGKKWKDRVASWEERAGLGLPSVKLALGFLDVLGVTRASVYKQLLENALRTLLDKIPHLTEERMLLLLNDSFRYATQPELKSVPLKIITSMSVVPDKVLQKIIELQTHEPTQFAELGLPLAIKRLAWEKDAKLFVRIASPAAERYISSEFAPKMIVASQQVRFYKHLDTIKRRKLMGPQRISALAECTGGRPILIGYLCDEIANRFKQQPSLSKAGLWATLMTDVLVTARERAYGNIADPAVDRLCALASRLDLAVREDVFGDAAVRDVQRLFREATGIGEDQQDKTKGTRRAAVLEKSKHEDESTKLSKTLKTAWSSVLKMDKNGWFKEPVTEAIAPGYHKLIKTPMDLGTILKKIKGGGYPSFGDFDRDLRLMWENCRVFNGTGTLFYDEAMKLEEEWNKVAPSFEDVLRQHESRSSPAPAPAPATAPSGNKRKSSGSQPQPDAPLAAMAPATQLDGQGLGRRVGLAAVLLSEPFAAKLMYRHASERVLEACRDRETLPRDHPTFAPLLQLLELGAAARAMFRAGSFGVRAVEEKLTRTVLPCVVALHARAEDALARRGGEGNTGTGTLPADGSGAGIGTSTSIGTGSGTGSGTCASGGASVSEKADAEDAEVSQDWKAWYREFPAVRRVTCTMLCRSLVRGGDEAAAVMMPAARVAVRKMGDEQWLWASLGELLQKSATAAEKKEGEKGATRLLTAKTLKDILDLFSLGLDSAAVSDAVFSKALDLVTALLPVAPPSSTSSTAAAPLTTPSPRGVPRAALEELVDKAAGRASRPPRTPRTDTEEKRLKEAFESVFAKAPEWENKLSDRKKAAAAAAAAASAAAGGGGGGRPPRPGRSVSIKGPKRKAVGGAGAGAGAAGGGEVARAPARAKVLIKGPKRKHGEGTEAGSGAGSGTGASASAISRKRGRVAI